MLAHLQSRHAKRSKTRHLIGPIASVATEIVGLLVQLNGPGVLRLRKVQVGQIAQMPAKAVTVSDFATDSDGLI